MGARARSLGGCACAIIYFLRAQCAEDIWSFSVSFSLWLAALHATFMASLAHTHIHIYNAHYASVCVRVELSSKKRWKEVKGKKMNGWARDCASMLGLFLIFTRWVISRGNFAEPADNKQLLPQRLRECLPLRAWAYCKI